LGTSNPRRSEDESLVVVGASIAANVGVAATKFVVAAISASPAMLAEGVHSLANCFDGGLLLLGARRSRQPADDIHPFGYGRELYFWSFVVAVVFFTLGAGFTLYNGVDHVVHPEPLRDPTWNYVVLAAAAVFDGTSFLIGFKAFRRRAKGRSYSRAILDSKNPALFSTVLEDAADVIGLACAFLGIYFAHRLGMPALDGVASIAIGALLAVLAIVLLVKTHRLLIGESAGAALVASIRHTADRDPLVVRIGEILTVHTGPEEVVLLMRLGVQPDLPGLEIARQLSALEATLRREHPELRRIFFDITDHSEHPAHAFRR